MYCQKKPNMAGEFDLIRGHKLMVPVCKRILLSRNVCVLTKIIRGKFRSCGFGSNFCPVEVAQWPKASVQCPQLS